MKYAALALLIPVLVWAASVRQLHETTELGTNIILQMADRGPIRRPLLDDPEIAWHRNHPVGIFSSTALSSRFAYSGSWLNDPREAARYEFDGNGTPVFVLTGYDWKVAAAPQGGLWAAVNRDQSNNSVLYLLADSLPDPLWSYALGQGFPVSVKGLHFSSDGLVLAAFITSQIPVRPRILLWDVQVPDSIPVLYYEVPEGFGDFGRALALSSTGEVIAFTAGTYLHIIESDGSVRDSINLQASADPLALSPDGSYVMAGFPAIHTYRWTGEEYQMVWSFRLFNSYCSQVLISPDLTYAVTCWYPATYNRNYVRVHRMENGFPVWWHYYAAGSGNYQDMVVDVDVNADGSWFVLGSWGDQGNTNGEAVVFSRYYPEPYYELDMPGSCNSVSISDEGPFLLAGGKHVHANEFGSGGDLYLVDLDLPTEAIPALADTVLRETGVICVCSDTIHLTLLLLNFGYSEVFLDSASLRPLGNLRWDESHFTLDSSAFTHPLFPRDTIPLQWTVMPCLDAPEFQGYELTAYFPDTAITRFCSVFLAICDAVESRLESVIPTRCAITAIYPNPLNSSARIEFMLPRAGEVSFTLSDILGRTLRETRLYQLEEGVHSFTLNAGDLASGIYFVNLHSNFGIITRKIALIR